jgi:ATP-binding protein involved in chromosome partitioning
MIEHFSLPEIHCTLGQLGAVTEVTVEPQTLRISLELPIPSAGLAPLIEERLGPRLAPLSVSKVLQISVISRIRARAVQKPLKPLPGIANVVAVSSGKGGVGKSTIAVNLALAWAQEGARVGLLDADIYGPSQPLMLGLESTRPRTVDGKRILPPSAHGVKAMSIGLLIDPSQPAVWRGPMVTQALTQLLADTEWGELDYLVIDMPPGTGDLQLTLAQRIPVAGAVVVTMPQPIAVAAARKGLKMFEKVSIPVLGVVENMATHVCTACGHEDAIFGAGGGEDLAAESGVALLGRLALDAQIRDATDQGQPTVVREPGSARAQAYLSLSRRVATQLALRPRDRSAAFGTVVVEES